MDSTENLLAGSGELSQESDDIICALAVEATGRLIEEEQKLGLGRELNADGNSFSGWNATLVRAATGP